ncbi:efflux transporter, RND family, MFP subunit [Alkaliphilus metalliredigens QYMF]|uniref:Efflux transporter, RND family, MFP subunit n=1 Tax=Alkaliphilus metalliredigens (strain QYMF) TaxID=293826 RepID=A6TMX3_ALKMQ|nr:biotin/lipoyl-binding protein [Alkaliphilus metalliredigens]ABR47541.1 efflux transporter, RND family, MFP subunit [Alkaliphilus metalliredigens QYMF]
MKKLIALMILGLLVLTGCQTQVEIEVVGKNVRIVEAETRKYPVTLEYMGIMDTEDTRSSAFKTGGKIEEIYVKTGQQINKGDKLIRLNEEDLRSTVNVAKAQYEIAETQYNMAMKGATEEEINQAKISVEMAERNLENTKELYGKYQELLEAGAVSPQQLQEIKLKLDLEEKQLNSAKEAYNRILKGARDDELQILKSQIDIAYAAYQQSQDLLEDSILRSDIDGVILQIQVKEGDYISQEMPVIIIKGEETTVMVGVSNEDISKIALGMDVIVRHQNNEVKGIVETVSSNPKSQSSLYEVKVDLEPNTIPIGSLVSIDFILGEAEGVFLPMNILLNEGVDFVYIVQDERAVMQEVLLGEVFGNEIKVLEGINPGDKVIVEGMRSVKNNDKVEIKE